MRAAPTSRSRRAIELVGGFESTYQPAHDVDGMESTDHHRRWRSDLELLRGTGVRRLRYPVRWHRVEPEPGVYDWSHTDEVFEWMADAGLVPIVDLLHHTSYPRWLGGFTDPRFGPAYLAFVEEVARRYPWVAEYTLCNEPFTTFFLCGHEGVWPPHLHGMEGFVDVAGAVLPVVAEASRRCRELLPKAHHVWVDVCERHNAVTEDAVEYAALANDRRFFVLDAFLGLPLDDTRPFVRAVAEAGGEALLGLRPGHVDVVGLDYYAHCQWDFTGPHGEGRMHSAEPASLASLIVEYADRYQRPVALTETNVRGYASDRASWFKYTLEQCELAQEAGVELDGYCWFPFVDSCDWDSTLCRGDGNVDPVGVYWLDKSLERLPSCMSESWGRVAQGARAAELPAYRFREPVATWLRGWLPQMAHWDWQDPPVYPSDPPPPEGPVELRIPDVVE